MPTCDSRKTASKTLMVMKKIVALSLGLSLYSCSAEISYSILGMFDGDSVKDSTVVRLYDMYDRCVDSTLVDNGTFIFKGSVHEPALRYIAMDDRIRIAVVCEMGETSISFDEDLVPYLSGTHLNGRINTINSYVRSQYRKYRLRTAQARDELAGESLDSALLAIKSEIRADISRYYGRCVEDNRDNIVSGYVMMNWAGMLDTHLMDSVLSTITYMPSRELPPVVSARNRRYNMERSATGRPFIDIIGADASGNPARLSGIAGKGRPAVLFFWASWCGECVGQTALLKAIAERYGDDGPLVVGIDVWEDRESDFRAAINLFGMSWPHIYVRDDAATDAYAVDELPFTVVLDGNGTIVHRSRHITETEEAIDSLVSLIKADSSMSDSIPDYEAYDDAATFTERDVAAFMR